MSIPPNPGGGDDVDVVDEAVVGSDLGTPTQGDDVHAPWPDEDVEDRDVGP